MFSWQMSGFEPNFESFSVFEFEKYSSIQVGKQTGMGLQLKSFTTSNWETLPNMPQSGFKIIHKYKLKYMIKDVQIQNFYKVTSCLIWQNVGSGFKTNLKLHKLGKPTLQMGIEWCSAVSKGISFKRFAWDEWNYGRESMYMLSVFFI